MPILEQPGTTVKPKPVTGRTTIVPGSGEITYRSVLMPEGQARRFERCLKANPKFRRVELVRSEQAKPPATFYVRYLPASDSRSADLHAREEQKRAQSADEHGAAYQFHKDPDSQFLWWCVSDTQEVYELTGRGGSFVDCNCPDREFRGRKCGIPCKHMQAGDRRRLASHDAVSALTQAPQTRPCSHCEGTGWDRDCGADEPCFFCSGTGRRVVKS